MSDFENQLAAQARTGMNIPSGAADFQIVVTEAQYPVGTVMRRGSTIPIDYTACAPPATPRQFAMPSVFPSYNLTSAAAASFGLDNSVLSAIAGAGIKVNGDRTVTVTIADPQIEVIADRDLSNLVAGADCSAAIQDQVIWYVRGYIVAKRTFLTSLSGGADASVNALKVGNFDVTASSQNSVGISDSQPVGFLEIISEISPPSSPAAVGVSGTGHHHSLARPGDTASAPSVKISIPTSSVARGRIYVQEDRADTTGNDAKIVAALTAAGLSVVPKVQKIESNKMPAVAQVRYFNTTDAPVAKLALANLKSIYPGAKLIQFKLPAPQGQFEVWLPKIT